MTRFFQVLALVGLAFASAVIVFVVNAPKWLDGKVTPPTTRSTQH